MTIVAKLQGFILPAILVWLDFTCLSFGSPFSNLAYSKNVLPEPKSHFPTQDQRIPAQTENWALLLCQMNKLQLLFISENFFH